MAESAAAQDNFTRALGLHRAGRLAEAAELYRALSGTAAPCAVDARINLGTILDGAGCHREALLQYREALALRGGDPVALNNMGNTLMALGEFAEAADSFRAALDGAPDNLATRIALGAALQREGDSEAAIACFRETLQRAPDCAEAHWNLSLALLTEGAYREGWSEYQWRWRRDTFTSPARGFSQPVWDGSPLAGRRILVHCEQGLGDTIQFLRYLPMLAAAGGIVLAEVQSASLIPLVRRIPGISGTFVMGEALPPFDLQVPLLSLPHLFDTTLDNLPAEVPYLSAPPERVADWQRRMAGVDGFRVGLVWAGKPVPDPFRSCTLEVLAPLASIPGVLWYSLQVGEYAAQALAAPADLELIDLTAAIEDFGDTAALVANLDLVISVDTSVAHLAGALGKPVWLMLPKAADWRWLKDREDSPWYPGMRLFRQEHQGEWSTVVERMVSELRRAAGSYLERQVAREPFNGCYLHLWGTLLAEEGRHLEATVRFSKAALLMPHSWEPHYGLACSLQLMGRASEAEESLTAALARRDDLPLLHEALGVARQLQGKLAAARESYAKALSLDPNSAKARYNVAITLRESGQFCEALREFREVVRRFPEHADAHWNLAVLLLVTGELAEGWREFPWRFQKSGLAPKARWQECPRWDGSPLAGRTILVYGEQGLGDTLQFVRYLPLLAARGAQIVAEVQSPALSDLVARVAGVTRVLVAGETPPPFDLQASLMDLPALFGTTLDTIPHQVPYLVHDPARLARAAALVPRDGSFRVGLVWGGSRGHENDANRSLPLERLALVAGIPGVSFYSLQFGAGEADAARFPELGITDLSAAIADFSDTAALAAQLDLVLTVDTSVAHLCGGLGLPVWVLIPFIPDWRWLLCREDSPWYPTLRLFRQQSPGDWDGVLRRVRDALVAAAAPTRDAPAPAVTSARDLESVAHRDRGLALNDQGRFAEAAGEFELALAGNPPDAELLNNLGCALDNAGSHQEAVQVYQRAIALKPGFCAPHYNMGNSLKSLGRSAEAAESYRRAVALDPGLPQGWHNLAVALQDLGRFEEAQESLERALILRPDYLEARHNLGEVFHACGDLTRAVECFRQVLAQNAGYLPSWNALGISCQALDRLDEAVECYRRALAIDPGYLHALNNLGAACRALCDFAGAVECYQRAITLDPGYADAHWNLALVQLQLGNYDEGWQGYEWRFRKADPIPLKDFPRPLWAGGDLAGRTILIHAEQGFGDTFQFVRYATLLAKRGGTVLVQCQSEAIAGILASVPGVSRVLVRGEPLPEFDCHAPLMSLPFLCGTRLDSVPATVPYLRPDSVLVEQWGRRMAAARGGAQGKTLRVGLVWAGRKTYQDDARRSLSLPLFAPLAGVPRVSFYALQVGAGVEQLVSPPPGMELVDLGSGVRNFSDSAAIIANLDLLISADTAVAHLAGALGTPVWVLLPKACDWRWLVGREDSPWYPSARLFRQTSRGDWAGVLERVAQQLALVASAGAQAAEATQAATAAPAAQVRSVGSAGSAGSAGKTGPASADLQPALAELSRLLQANQLQPAEELCRALLSQAPDHVELITLAGALARGRGDTAQALVLFQRAAGLKPALPELHNNLGVTLQDLGRLDEALSSYRQALVLRPDYCEAHCNLANTLCGLGCRDEAIDHYRQALAGNPRYPDALYNLGNAQRAGGNWPEAVDCYRRLLELVPTHLSGWLNLGGSLIALNRFGEAAEAERQALLVDPQCREAHWNLGHALLAQGHYREGWREYEWRLKDATLFPEYCVGKPLWDGSALNGRTLLLRAEQGFGDALQFFRYVPLLAQQGAKLVVECRKELFPLFASQQIPAEFFAVGDQAPPFDCFAYLMSLPHLVGTTLDSIPAEAYLSSDAGLTREWAARMPAGGALRVGLVWSGSPLYQDDPYRYRSLPPDLLAPLSHIPGIELFSLQPGATADLPATPAGVLPLHDLGSDLRHFADTAALIANLDLVLTVDTAVAHLAGALGARTFLLLPYSCDWRWLSGRDDSPWYPTLRLYRQDVPGDWETAVARVAADLAREPRPQRQVPAVATAAAARQPEDPNALFKRANALRSEGNPGAAVTLYRKVLELRPDSPEACNNLGLALQDAGDPATAELEYRRALALNPGLADAWNNLGTLLVSRDRRTDAVPCFRQAIALCQEYLPAYVNLGCALQHLERADEAVHVYRRALELKPASLEALINLGTAYQDLLKPDLAIRTYHQALEIDPACADAHWNLALSLLSQGEFEKGWQEYEWRLEGGVGAPVSAPRWDGSPLAGRSILLWCEQGLGDTLQFVRYARLVAQQGGTVLIRCQAASFKPLLKRVAGVAQVFGPGDALPPVDCQAPLLSLPHLFGTRLERMPAPVPYLNPDPERVALWRDRMATTAPVKVGLVWKGGPLPKNRACPFEEFAALAALPGIAFFSLQLGDSPQPGPLPVLDLAPGIRDFADSAAIIANLDLVLTVDTACAHLAGGLGARVWTLLPRSCDWRWLVREHTSPWYPSMRLYRQESSGDWPGVLCRVRAALTELVSGPQLERNN